MKAIVTSDTLNEVCKTDTAHLSNGFNEVVECNKAYVNEDRFTAISSNLVDGTVIDLQKLIDDAVKKAIDALIGEGTDGLPDDVIQVIDDKINNNPEIVNITQKIEDGIKQITGDIEGLEDGTIAGELDKYDKILAEVGTTLDGDGNEVEGLKAQVSEHAVAYNTINEEVNRSGAMYTLDVTAGGAVAGFTALAYEDTNGNSTSEFIVEADKFLVARGIDDDGNVVGTPPFAIDGNNIAMNGRVSFTNLTNGNGETIINGGLITTDEVRIANSLVVGSTIAPINYGKFPVTVDDTKYLTPDDDYIDKAILKKILPIGTHLQFGDKYSDDTNEYEYVFEGGGSWKSVQDVASKDTTAKVNAAKQDATAKANSAEQAAKDALAQNIGYTDYDNMVSVAESTGKIIASGGYLNANVIDADAIFAKDISASGTITGATLKGSSGEFTKVGDPLADFWDSDTAALYASNSDELGTGVVTKGRYKGIESRGYIGGWFRSDPIGDSDDPESAPAVFAICYGKAAAVSADTAGTYGFFTGDSAYIGDTTYPFTGAHIGYIKDLDTSSISIGDIVCDTGKNMIHLDISNSISESEVSFKAKNKRVVGVYNGQKGLDHNAFIDKSLVEAGINSIGEGLMNVCDQAGDIIIGDYICSSDVQGKGMKQDDDLMHNYTVAKARESIIWDNLEEYEELDNHKWTQIACTYHCG